MARLSTFPAAPLSDNGGDVGLMKGTTTAIEPHSHRYTQNTI